MTDERPTLGRKLQKLAWRLTWLWITLLFLLLGYLAYLRPMFLGLRQVKTLADGRSLAGYLDSYRSKHGHYPDRLHQALPSRWSVEEDGNVIDPWGHPYVYSSDGDAFVLVSYGKGGHPDRTDYRLILSGQEPRYLRICGHWARDTIISNLGTHQGCGK